MRLKIAMKVLLLKRKNDMENIIRNVLFFLSIIDLVVYFLPGRPPLGDILENSSPLLIFVFVIAGFMMKAKKEAKKRGISIKGKDFQKFLIAEAKKFSETQSHKKK